MVCTGLLFDERQEDGGWLEADWMLEYVKRGGNVGEGLTGTATLGLGAGLVAG